LAELLVTERLCRGLPGQHHAVAHHHHRIPREQARQLLLVTRLDGGADRGAALAETPDPAAIAGDEEERRDAGVAGGEPARGRELPDPERYRWPDPEAWQVSRRDLGRELGCRAPGRGAGHEQALDEGCGRGGRWPEASHVHEQEAVAAIGMRDPVGEAAGDAAAGTVREGQLVLEDVRTAVGELRARGPGARR